jgi:hypothetical protein
MAIVGGLDIHRRQMTFDFVDTVTGQIKCGQITCADRTRLRMWLGKNSPARAMSRSRSRRAPGGGTWSRSSPRPASRRIWRRCCVRRVRRWSGKLVARASSPLRRRS